MLEVTHECAPGLEGSLLVSEVFGPTFQGEGPTTGQRCAFVRLGACNLHCKWCDTAYTWDSRRFDLKDELSRRPVCSIVKQLSGMDVQLFVISGGEPLLQAKQQAFENLVTWMVRFGDVEIETNGTKAPPLWMMTNNFIRFNVSPKLAHAGDPEQLRINPDVLGYLSGLERYTRRVSFKFVIRCSTPEAMREDLDEVSALVKAHDLRNVWVMPEGTDWRPIIIGAARLADHAIERGFNMSTRLQTLAWGSERGK